MVRDDGADRYVVLQRKGQLFPAVYSAAHRLCRLPVWRGRDAVDPSPVLDSLEDVAMQVAFFCGVGINASLERLLTAARAVADTVRTIQAASRPGFGGNVDERLRPDDEAGRRRLDHAITAFVEAARADLRIDGSWLPVHPAS
ncbi:hypothetical protein Q5425_32110 [Amycolatopsis sp. A133]|uniref:hypothetical protein n=1 Tax=Amycolatopsis sp. A133 TaxID=3064472 RepID=UPI0027E5DAD0|nr:hypothetical protein [Amycolatopsis sp. A133]MDQ7808403.1 hypothetical protein [Amycolatopsis sp. A133]